MKMKRLVSAIAALAMSVSAFAGLTAYAETYYSQDYQTATAADWTTGTSGRYDPILVTEGTNVYLSVNQDNRFNNGATVTGPDMAVTATNYTLEWDMVLGGVNNQTSTFSITDSTGANVLTMAQSAAGSATWNINGNKSVEIPGSYVYKAEVSGLTWYHYTLTFNEGSTYLSIANDSTTVLDKTVLTTLATNGGLKQMKFATARYFANIAVDNIVARSVETDDLPTAASVNYTINYTLNGTAIATTASSNLVGETVTADTIVYGEDGAKYFITAETAPSMVLVDGTNTLDVPVRAANNYTVTFAKSGELTGTIATIENVVEGETAKAAYAKYIADGTTLYETTTAYSSDTKGYEAAAKNVVSDTTVEIPYTTVSDTTVAYYSEAEAIEGGVAVTSGNANARCSLGTGAYFEADTDVTTLPAGKYIIKAAVWGGEGVTFNITAGENVLVCDTLGWFNEYVGEEITLTEDTAVTVSAAGQGGSSSKVLDYILIVKTGDVEVEAPTLTTDPPIVEVEEFGEYTEYEGNPAKAYTGTFTVDPTKHYPVSSVTWYVGEASTTTDFDTVISGGTVVTGLVVVAEDLSAIPTPLGYCGLYYGE